MATHAAEVVQLGHTLGLFLLLGGWPLPLLATVGVGSGSGAVSS